MGLSLIEEFEQNTSDSGKVSQSLYQSSEKGNKLVCVQGYIPEDYKVLIKQLIDKRIFESQSSIVKQALTNLLLDYTPLLSKIQK